MLPFNYRATDGKGKSINRIIMARDISDAKRKIEENGLIPVNISAGSNLMEKLNALLVTKVNTKLIALFCRQLHIIIKSGVNILNGLDILRNQTKNKQMKNIIGKMFNEVQKGQSLSQAMSDIGSNIPALLVNMVSVGEVSGNLDEILGRMAVYYEKESFMREKLKNAMTYPIILISMGIVMALFFMNFVLPEIMKLLIETGAELPLITRMVIKSVDAIKKYYLLFFIAVAGVAMAIKTTIPKEKLRLILDSLIVKIPIVSTSVRNVVTSRFMRTLSMMLKGGIPLLQVLDNAEKIMGNAIAEKGIKAAIDGVTRGERLGDNIATCGYFDPIVIHMINMGEETGELDNILEAMADYYDKEAETWLMKMMAMVEPVFTIIVGIFIGVIVVSMMLPMFGMLSQLNP